MHAQDREVVTSSESTNLPTSQFYLLQNPLSSFRMFMRLNDVKPGLLQSLAKWITGSTNLTIHLKWVIVTRDPHYLLHLVTNCQTKSHGVGRIKAAFFYMPFYHSVNSEFLDLMWFNAQLRSDFHCMFLHHQPPQNKSKNPLKWQFLAAQSEWDHHFLIN